MQRQYIIELSKLIKNKKPNKEELSKLKINLCSKYKLKKIPTDIEVLLNTDIKDIPQVKKFLITKPVRTISGVAVIAVMTQPFNCPHGKCIMCPGGIDSAFGSVPQSYTGKEPATRRAIRNNFDPYLQAINRLEQYVVSGHIPDKIELIIMGGTFPSFPKKYKEQFITYCLKAMNDFSLLFFWKNELDLLKFKEFFELPGDVGDKDREQSIQKKLLNIKDINITNSDIKILNKKIPIKNKIKKINLENEQTKNETAAIRCIGLTIETRPDYGKLKHGNEMLKFGGTRVELGVQTVYDDVLKNIERGHTVKDSIQSTRILKDLGFKINYHVMPGLPGVSQGDDLAALNEYFSNPDFRPDMLKIYPTMVLKGTKLYDDWQNGRFSPITTKKAAELIVEFKKYIPEYVRIMRVQRDIPTFMIEKGVDRTNLRQYIHDLMNEKGVKCRCIRCREIGDRQIKKYEIKVLAYEASCGMEYFISAQSNDYIVGFCRMRFPSQLLRKEITKDSALIRELHVYGTATGIGKKGSIQHKGIGKELLKNAEEIAREKNKKKIVIISGVGARQYYQKLGYSKDGPYMSKNLNKN